MQQLNVVAKIHCCFSYSLLHWNCGALR